MSETQYAEVRRGIQRDGWTYGVAVDVETTGIANHSKIVQIAALRFRYRAADIEFSDQYRMVELIRPPAGTYFDPGAVAVTGIGPDEAAKGRPFKEVVDRLIEVVGPVPLVAHNASFDRRFINREMEDAGKVSYVFSRWDCTLALCRGRVGSSLKLGRIADHLGIAASGALHDAGADAELAARIYARMSLPHVPVQERSPGLAPAAA